MSVRVSMKQRLLEKLWDLEWHHRREFQAMCGNRYGARFDELRDEGWVIESESLGGGDCDGKRYRLVSHNPGPVTYPQARMRLPLEAMLSLSEGTMSPDVLKAAAEAAAKYIDGGSGERRLRLFQLEQARWAGTAWPRGCAVPPGEAEGVAA